MAAHQAYSLYCTARFVGTVAGSWKDEIAIMGWRLGATAYGDALPSTDAGEVSLQAFNVNDASTTSTTTHLNKQQGWAGDSGVSGVNITDGDQDGIAEAVWTFLNASKGNMSPQYTLQDIRLYPISGAGKMASNAPVIYTPISALTGTGSSGLPPQLAAAISTQSATNGRRGRGRFYFGPLAQNAIGSDGRLAVAITGSTVSVLANAQAMMQAWRSIGSVASSEYYPIVYSHGALTGHVVRNLRCGNLVDTQTRRRHQEPEVYTSVAL